jgi:protein-disulfide isomerase
LKADIPVKGSLDSKIMIIEYSDAECPFCQRHFDAKTLSTVSDKYGDDVSLSFRHYPLSFHPNAGPAAEAMECARVQGDDEAFFAVENGIFTSKNLTAAGLQAAATEAGVDMDVWQDCMDNGDTKARVAAQMSEGQTKFGVRGTPGNVVINMETGDYELVSGAQQAGAFDAVITRMLGN